jgi:GDP-mannose 6-dehydrogenase
MRVSVFGLGYVGIVSAACFSNKKHDVIGVDVSQTKVDLVNGGHSPIIEDQIDGLVKKSVDSGKLRATMDFKDAIINTDISFLAVGTPSQSNGNIDLQYIFRVCEQIGSALKEKTSFHMVAIRSTVFPGTVNKAIELIEKNSGKKHLVDFDVCSNPEFLREGTAVNDFNNPPYTVIGLSNVLKSTKAKELLTILYKEIDNNIIFTHVKVAELIKYANNSFHALKVAFANEIGNIGKKIGIDSHEVMRIFTMDKQLNLSPYYLKPGFAFGGSCLPKDVRALNHYAKVNDVETPVLNNVLNSNENQIKIAFDMIQNTGKKKIGVLGFSFKEGTDDLRESPVVELIERLLGKGFDLKIYDENVNLAKLMGANKDFIENHIPHINNLTTTTVEQVIEHSDVIIIGNKAKKFKEYVKKMPDGKQVIDLVRLLKDEEFPSNYQGICW